MPESSTSRPSTFRGSLRDESRNRRVKTIAHVLPFPGVGGTEHATLRIAAVIDPSKFKSIAFCLPHAPAVRALFEDHGIASAIYEPAVPSYRHSFTFMRSSWKIAREFKRQNVDLVHCADVLAAYHAALAGMLARVPVLCHVRARFDTMSQRDCSFLRPVNSCVFVSENTRGLFRCKRLRSTGTVIYDGIDTITRPDDLAERRAVCREFGIPDEAILIGMVARVAPVKDFATLARAAASVLVKHPNVRFLIVGDHASETGREHYSWVRDMVRGYNLDDYFVFTGHRDDVSRIMGALDIFVLSTHLEGLPLVILEAMALTRPVVATAVGGIPEIVSHGETGLLFRPKNHEELAAHLTSLICDPVARQRLANNGRSLVQTRFSRTRFSQDLNALYTSVLGLDETA